MKLNDITDICRFYQFLQMGKSSLKIRSVNVNDSFGSGQFFMVDLRRIYQDVETFVKSIQTPYIDNVRLIGIEAFFAFPGHEDAIGGNELLFAEMRRVKFAL